MRSERGWIGAFVGIAIFVAAPSSVAVPKGQQTSSDQPADCSEWHECREFALPADPVGTLVLKNPAGLTAHEQSQLFDWIGRHPAAQIITVTSEPLYPLVQAGVFSDDLYYRLNAFMIAEPAPAGEAT